MTEGEGGGSGISWDLREGGREGEKEGRKKDMSAMTQELLYVSGTSLRPSLPPFLSYLFINQSLRIWELLPNTEKGKGGREGGREGGRATHLSVNQSPSV